jgi:hypothetical protein
MESSFRLPHIALSTTFEFLKLFLFIFLMRSGKKNHVNVDLVGFLFKPCDMSTGVGWTRLEKESLSTALRSLGKVENHTMSNIFVRSELLSYQHQ